MKSGFINLLAFHSSQSDMGIFQDYKKINRIDNIDNTEIEAINKIYFKLKEHGLQGWDSRLSGYLLGVLYKGVGSEEFDMLRFSEQRIINIELKSTNVPNENILRQLKRHSFLLSSISSTFDVSLYTFILETEKLFKYDKDQENLVEISFEQLLEEIPDDFIEYNFLDNLDDTSFIISPYSEPDRFFNSQYFLNIEQEKAKKMIIESSKSYVGLKGAAGTGKSLILFDVAKELSNCGLRVLFIFCSGIYDTDTEQKINENNLFNFIDIRKFNIEQIATYDIVIIDESQRLKREQWNKLAEITNAGKINKLILSVDNAQTLRPEEDLLDIQGILSDEQNNEGVEYVDCLTERVRTDIELSTFIRKFFNKKERNLSVLDFPKVNAVYFEDKDMAKDFIASCEDNEGFVSIEMPEKRPWGGNGRTKLPKFYYKSLDGFTVIGREYDKVLLPLTDRVYYHPSGALKVISENGYKYLPEKALFQAITRVKKQLLLVVIQNRDLFNSIQEILTWKEFRDKQRIAKRIKAIREIHSYETHTVANRLGLTNDEYIKIETSGQFSSINTLKKLAKLYSVSPQYFEGFASEIDYSKIDLIYKKKTEEFSRDQKELLEQEIMRFIQEWGQ